MRFWRHIFKIRRTRNKSSGLRPAFTLVELVVATTIFAFIAAAIGVSLYSGIKLWDRARNVDIAKANLLLDLERIARELYQCADITQIGFEGDARGFSFPSVSGSSIVKIVYRFDPADKALYKTEIGLKDILENKDKKQKDYPSARTLSLDEFSAVYYYYDKDKKSYVETGTWTKDKGIFNVIELRVGLKDEKITKKIFIPIS